MFSGGFFEVLKQILTSWQVIVVTAALIIFIYIVSYVSRDYHPKRTKKIKIKMQKSRPVQTSEGPEETDSESDSNDDLGLEEN